MNSRHRSGHGSNTFQDRALTFTEESSLHGLDKIFKRGNHVVVRVLWIVILLIMLVIYLWLVATTIRKYLRYETVTSVEKIWNSSIDFPQITVCNVNKVAKSKMLDKFPQIMATFELAQNRTYSQFRAKARKLVNDDVLSIPIKRLYLEAGISVNDTFLHCRWQNKIVPCADHVKTVLTDINYCYSIHTEKILRIIQPGADFGMTLVMDAHQEEYTITPHSTGAGIYLLVHDQNIYPIMQQRALAFAPGFAYYVAITREETIRLQKPYASTDCVYTDEDFIPIGKTNYSYEACLSLCKMKQVYGPCGCDLLGRNGVPLCTIADLLNCGNYNFTDEQLLCDCLPACYDISYKTRVSSLAFPDDYEYRRLYRDITNRRNFTDITNNILTVNIYFDSMEYTVMRQSPAMTVPQLIADIGGQLGLFLGASLITVAEFFEFFANVIWRMCTPQKLSRSHPDSSTSV